ncbi:MAG: hypothetical protein COA57_02570 [Flavobacteriales bacterium]|nr:MAG: hypothetical protein COA57_02570 [Flavobacteriales bacterium]
MVFIIVFMTEPKDIKKQTIETSAGWVRIVENNLIEVGLCDYFEIDIETVRELHKTILNIAEKGKKHILLVYLGHGTIATKKARDFAAKLAKGDLIIAEALLASNLAHRLMGNFYIKFHKPTRPSKVFIKKESAIKWLRKIERQSQENVK